MAKQQWEVVDSASSVMRSLKKILHRCESLTDAINWREQNGFGDDDTIRIRTKIEARAPKDEETTNEVPTS